MEKKKKVAQTNFSNNDHGVTNSNNRNGSATEKIYLSIHALSEMVEYSTLKIIFGSLAPTFLAIGALMHNLLLLAGLTEEVQKTVIRYFKNLAGANCSHD